MTHLVTEQKSQYTDLSEVTILISEFSIWIIYKIEYIYILYVYANSFKQFPTITSFAAFCDSWSLRCQWWQQDFDSNGPLFESSRGRGWTGSTISTVWHDKINPKDCQVLSLGDSRFLQFFRVVSSDYGKPRWMNGVKAECLFICVCVCIKHGWARFILETLRSIFGAIQFWDISIIQMYIYIYIWYGPLPVTVTTRIIRCLVGDSY